MIKPRKNSFRKKDNLFLNGNSYSKRKTFIFLFVLLIIILFLNLTSFSIKIRDTFYSFSRPVEEWFWEKGLLFSDFFGGFLNNSKLKSENELLISQNRNLLNKNVELETLKEENEKLRSILNLEVHKDFNLSTAQVISRDSSNNFITINKGSKNDVKPNYPLITEEKVLIGKVVEVYEDISKVKLLSSKESLINVESFENEVEGLLRGNNTSNYIFDFIPEDAQVKEGELVITSNLGENFPEGLLIGNISTIQKSEQPSFKKSKILPLVEIKDLDEVFIILSSHF
jgi:rod shape-determining protein MreC